MADKNKTANSVVYESLRQQIFEGNIYPGSWLREQDLVEAFNVSRTPIREALRRLESEGVVESVPFRGVKVVSLNPEDIWEEYMVRIALESLAFELAVSNMSDETIHLVEQMVQEMEGLLDERNLGAFLEINRTFHLTLYNLSGSHRLVSMIESSWNRENLYRLKFLMSFPAAFEMEKAIHREMLDVCRRRDGGAARNLVKKSLLEGATLLTGRDNIKASNFSLSSPKA
jgi:DNA-binding GntR family transcriptional regulator